MQQKLFKDMTHEEQLRWATDFSKFTEEKLPVLEQLGDAWERCHIKDMDEGLRLLNAFQFCRDFVDKSLRYGDYKSRVRRFVFYIELIQKKLKSGEITKGINGEVYAIIVPKQQEAKRRGRPASAETIARREAEAKAAEQQTTMFGPAAPAPNVETSAADADSRNNDITKSRYNETTKSRYNETTTSRNNENTQANQQPFIAPASRDDAEYKLSIAQKRAFLSPDLQKDADKIRALRTTAGAAAEKAKTMAELKAAPELIAPIAEQAQRTLEQVNSIYAEIDNELAAIWYRLQNDSPEWAAGWCKKYGYKSAADLHTDLIYDLKKHYKKVTEAHPDFDARMRRTIEQESPEYIARQKEEAAKKKEVQDIIRYLKRKDKGVSETRIKTSREKFKRLQELLGKKEAADYKPLLTKIEDDYKLTKKATID